MARILVSGSMAYDRIMDYAGNFTDSLLKDKLHTLSVSFTVEKVVERFGGCAGNIAYNLALLGEEPEVIATVGRDFDRYAQHLHDFDIGVGTILTHDADLTSVAHIVTDRADNQIAAFALGAGARPYEEDLPKRDYACAMLSAGNLSDVRALAHHAKEHDIPYYFDPGQILPALSGHDLQTIIHGSAGVFGNDYEFALIEKTTGWSAADLLEKTPLLVTTLGAQGSRIITKEGTIEVSATPAQLVDPTGAGDAHRAGFLKGRIAGLPLKKCGELASVVAAFAVESVGTQEHAFTMAQIKERYESSYGESMPL